MNLPVNMFSESSYPSGAQTPEASKLSNQPESLEVVRLETISRSSSGDSTETTQTSPPRKQPIPPPNHPMQYRAIGLIQGQYKMSSEQMTRGTLLASDGTAIDAVLLGRMISIVKKHLDLEQSHLWVVYPRNRKEKDDLHVQIVGVWEPETLAKDPPLDLVPQSASQVQHGYFSIRGEIIYHSKETETAIIKIEQSPKKGETKPKSSKLKLKGILPDKVLGHFWDLQVQLQGDTLIIQKATDICRLPPKKKPFGKKKGKQYSGNRFGGRKTSPNSRPTLKGKKSIGVKPSPSKASLPKPIKRTQKKIQ